MAADPDPPEAGTHSHQLQGNILGRSWPAGFWPSVAFLAAVSLFLRTMAYGWVYDDQLEIVLNPLIQSLGYLPDIFASTAWAGAGMETHLYRPLTTLSYLLNHMVSGLDPWSYHLVNVGLHGAVSVLVFRVGLRWGLSALAAGLGALLFAVHPIHTEAVAPAFGRKDLLVAAFTLLMVLWHQRAVERGGWTALLPALALAGALLSKEVGMATLPLVAVQDWAMEGRRKPFFNNPRRARLYATYLGVVLAYLLIRIGVTGGFQVPDTSYLDNPLVAAPLGARMATAMVVIGKGLTLLFFPLVLSPDYSFEAIPLVESTLDWRFWVVVVAVGATLAILRVRSVRRSPIPLGLAWYLLALLPASNLLVPIGTLFGERLLYLPSVAFCLLAGWGLSVLVRRIPRAGGILTALVLILLSFQTFRYSSVWVDDIRLFTWATERVPNSTKAHHKLGEEYLRLGELGPALTHLHQSLDIAPDNEFAAVTLSQARAAVAREYPALTAGSWAVDEMPSHPEVLYALGQIRRERGDLSGARRLWEQALSQDPHHPESLADLGALRLMAGDTAAALDHFQAAVQGRPTLASAWYALARIHLARGETAQGLRALRRFVDHAGSRYPDQVGWARTILTEQGGI